MAGKSGLAKRLAYTVTAKTGTSYTRVLFGFIVVDFLLTFLVPSGIARVTILGTIALGVIEAFKVPRRSNIGRGLLIVITCGAGIYDKMLIAGATSILARGIIQNFTGTPILYSRWFIAYLPADVITIVVCQFLILWMYPPEKQNIEDAGHLQRQVDQLGPWRPAEKRCAIFLGLAVMLWMTDFIHHLSPSLIGIAVGLLGIMPGIGILEPDDVRKLHFGALWFTGAALSMGRILQETGGLSVLTDTLTWWMQPLVAVPFAKSMVLYWTGFVYHFFLANETAMLSTSLPIVLQFAVDNGLSPLTTGMIWTFSASAKIFVYQSAVLIVGYSFGCFEAKDMLKVGLVLSVVEAIILFLLVPLYWPLIGLV
jgi:solute carrier family 13 (sodium-dependent dicarboxylate transporter), member 2/3/5